MEESSSLKMRVVAALRERSLTVFAAESCTGGLVTKELTDVPGASSVLRGGIVSYVNDIKISLLRVSPHTIDTDTEVSPACAKEMAEGARAVSGSDIGLSTTGYASSGDGVPADMVGVVFLGIADRSGTKVYRCHFDGDRNTVRQAAVNTLFTHLLEHLTASIP